MGQIRIIAGEFKGRYIKVPGCARPLEAKDRKRIFDLLAGYIRDADVLDLFAGSGSFGIEALSRGAKNVTFVETNRNALVLLKKNCLSVKPDLCGVNIVKEDALRFIQRDKNKYDIIFVDPPFLKGLGTRILQDPSKILSLLHSHGILLLRLHKKEAPAESIFSREIKLGDGILYIHYAQP